jgi:hypothetical protein
MKATAIHTELCGNDLGDIRFELCLIHLLCLVQRINIFTHLLSATRSRAKAKSTFPNSPFCHFFLNFLKGENSSYI